MLNFPNYASAHCSVGVKLLKIIHSVSLHCVPAYISCDDGDDHQMIEGPIKIKWPLKKNQMIEGVTMFDAAARLHSVKRPV